MEPGTRRKEIILILEKHEEPISAKKIAKHFDVSRQVIVGDIALLRAEGQDIISTPRGYIYEQKKNSHSRKYIGKIVCLHSVEETEKELQIIVDNGGETTNVEVDHPLYGSISSSLRIRSRHDINEFIKKVKDQNTTLLASLTDGIHLHTIQCEDEQTFIRIKQELDEAGILYQQFKE